MRVKAMAYGTSHWHWVIVSETTEGGWHPRVCHGTDFELSEPLEARMPGALPKHPCETCEPWGTARGLPGHAELLERLRQGAEGLASQLRQNEVAITYEVAA
jgi:hypothetical protein